MEEILNSVYSDSTKFYVSKPYPKKGERVDVKLRIKENDKVLKIYLRYKRLGAEVLNEMNIAYKKNGMVYYKGSLDCLEDRINYHFYIVTKDEIYYYCQHKITKYIPDESNDFKILVDYDGPEWMCKTVFYQILTDRFCKSKKLGDKKRSHTYNGYEAFDMGWDQIPFDYEDSHCLDFYGGDLYGIIEKLDYLQQLGVNGIYLNPIFTSPTIHKYDALDYFEIDPSIGGDMALKELSAELHARKMKLILDISVNHTSSSAKWFNKSLEFYPKNMGAFYNEDSKERSYYFIDKDGNYESWWGVETMPSLNYSSDALRDVIYRAEDSVLKKWLKAPYNIDGWRFDVADVMARNEKVNVYDEVWKEINSNIKSTKKDALILAEEWTDAWEMYDGKRWDSTMNYFQVARPIREFAGEGDLFIARNEFLSKIKYKSDAKDLENRILQFMRKILSQIQYQMFNLIDSHDVPRLSNNKEIDIDVYKGAVICLMGLPGAANIYYGDEKYLEGRIDSNEGCRYPMDWSDDIEERKYEIFNLYRKLTHLKTEDEALQEGGFKVVYALGDIFAYSRFTEDKAYIFVWNKGDKDLELQIDLGQLGMVDCMASMYYGNYKLNLDYDSLYISMGMKESGVIKLDM